MGGGLCDPSRGGGTHWGCSAGGRGCPNPRVGSTGRAGTPLWGAGGHPEQCRGASPGLGGLFVGHSDPKGGTPRGRGVSLGKGVQLGAR